MYRCVRGDHGGLAAAGRNCVCVCTFLDGDNVPRLAEHLEGSIVGGRQRRGNLVPPNKNKTGGNRQVHGRALNAWSVVGGRNRSASGHLQAEAMEKIGGRQ